MITVSDPMEETLLVMLLYHARMDREEIKWLRGLVNMKGYRVTAAAVASTLEHWGER